MTPTLLSASELATLVTDLVGAGTAVIAPVTTDASASRAAYRRIERLEEATLGGPLPRHSLKEFFLPPTEVLLRYVQRKNGVELHEVPTTFAPRVILGARPCDAASLEVLDRVMGWEPRDELWFGRREATTLVTLACSGVDSSCFCSALGLGPDSTKGADALLVPLDAVPERGRSPVAGALEEAVAGFLRESEPFAGASSTPARERHRQAASAYLAQAVTPRGEELLRGRGNALPAAGDVESAAAFVKAARARVEGNFTAIPTDAVPEWLAANFDHPLWSSVALRCHGCGTCAAVCPACHCFDIVDEHDTVERGCRRRNWDSCQTAKFTLHASGHNPRPTQTERFRQRVVHKFSIYPRRFGVALCTGCGRCARACAAGMSLREILGQVVQLAGRETAGSER